MKTMEERFFEKFKVNDANGCWEWTAYKDKDGYGRFKSKQAHRFAYLFLNGKDPGKKLVCHTCDNPACVNPLHLFLGSVKDNSEDMVKKGRSLKGAKNPFNKHDPKIIRLCVEMMKRHPPSRTGPMKGVQMFLSRWLNISQPQVSKIYLKQAWDSLKEEAE